MSLQVWLPLNGNTTNQGLSGISLAGSPASWSTGKIGKCATFSGSVSNVIYNNTTQFNYKDSFSYCLWIKQNYTGTTAQFAFTVGRADAGGYGYGVQIINASTIRCWFGTKTVDVACASGEWHHITLTVSGTTVKVYRDGVLTTTTTTATLPTYSDGNGLGIGCFHYSSNIYPFYGSINDFRIYDHCLSPFEVKEISKALVCHYKLSSQFETGQTNKYSGSVAEGYLSGSFTRTKLADERGYNYKLSYTGNGSNNWASMRAGNFSFTAGKKYYYSCKVRCHSRNFNMQLRASRSDNDWVTSMVNVLNPDGQWHEYVVSQTINATYDRAGSTVTCNPTLEFYTESLITSGTVYSADFDIKDIQVIESDCYVPFIDNTMVTSVTDCSGYGNNGTRSGTIMLNDNSPRYNGSYKFDVKSHYKIPNPLVSPNEFSCSFWIKPVSCGGYAIISANYGYPNTGFWLAVNCENCGLWFHNGSYAKSTKGLLTLNTWYHACFVFKTGVVTWYQNGEPAGSTDLSSRSTTLGISSYISIGNSYTGSTWNTNYSGNISDFRIYATALSAEDVKILYHTVASVDKSGVMAAYEFVEE